MKYDSRISASNSWLPLTSTAAGIFGGETDIQPLERLPRYTAYTAPLNVTTSLPKNTHLVAFELEPNVTVTFVVVTDDFKSYAPLLLDMIATIPLD